MTNCIAVFRSRSQAADCKARLCAAGVPAVLAGTPSSLGLGCGVSVKFPRSFSERAKRIIDRANYSAFYGYVYTR